MDQLGNNLLFNPFHNFAMTENLLVQKNRNYPVDFIYKSDQEFDIFIEVPENYVVLKPPAPYVLDNELAQIKLEYISSINGLNIKGHYVFKKSLFEPHEYSRIKSYMNSIVEKFNAPLILEKLK